jgi:hypothetical protein
VDGSILFVDRRDGEDAEHTGEYLEMVCPRRLVIILAALRYFAESTQVSIYIVRLPAGCEPTLTHERILPDYKSHTEAAWPAFLEGLAASLE